jgi:hypothetical protein
MARDTAWKELADPVLWNKALENISSSFIANSVRSEKTLQLLDEGVFLPLPINLSSSRKLFS